jgi:hypothetical protein
MNQGLSGQHEFTTYGGETVKAFVPNRLPPFPALKLRHNLQIQLQEATSGTKRFPCLLHP